MYKEFITVGFIVFYIVIVVSVVIVIFLIVTVFMVLLLPITIIIKRGFLKKTLKPQNKMREIFE